MSRVTERVGAISSSCYCCFLPLSSFWSSSPSHPCLFPALCSCHDPFPSRALYPSPVSSLYLDLYLYIYLYLCLSLWLLLYLCPSAVLASLCPSPSPSALPSPSPSPSLYLYLWPCPLFSRFLCPYSSAFPSVLCRLS